MIRRRRSPFAWFACALVAGSVAVGCQLLVPAELPAFGCVDNAPNACPQGQLCVNGACVGRCDSGEPGTACPKEQLCVSGRCVTTCRQGLACPEGFFCDETSFVCVPPRDGGDVEGGADEDAALPDTDAEVDSGPADVDGSLASGSLGAPCTQSTDCSQGFCAGPEVLTSIFAGGVCTTACCTSEDCPSGFTCFGAGTGGNYCVVATLIGRAAPGTKRGGERCDQSTECRSGLCTEKRCVDVCCSASDCASSTTCIATRIGLHEVFGCSTTTGSSDDGSRCAVATECKSNFCSSEGFGLRCAGRGCTVAACRAQGRRGPTYRPLDSDDFASVCGDDVGMKPTGSSCAGSTECATNLCADGKCVEICCVDRDCPSGLVCRPRSGSSRLLGCVSP